VSSGEARKVREKRKEREQSQWALLRERKRREERARGR
jgi:hypothetical protein